MRNIALMKRIFMLLAVVLLTSASAMAQSGNNSQLKGDVNSDGSVDVADIVAVIDLIQKGQGTGEAGYFYLGTTKPTAENFTTLAGAVATYTSIDEAVGTKVSVAAGETLYMLCPTSWTKEKSVALEDEGGETVNFSNDVDATTIPGYSIYETSAWKASSTATLKASPLYWFGITINKSDDYINPDNYNAMQGIINPVSNITEGEYKVYPNAQYLYIVIPVGYSVKVMQSNSSFVINMFTHNGTRFVRNTDATIENGTYKIYRSATLLYSDENTYGSIIITKES